MKITDITPLIRSIDPDLNPNIVRSITFSPRAIDVELFTGRYADPEQHIPGPDDDETETFCFSLGPEIIENRSYKIQPT